ncbi:MAG: twin-arginine translocase TatA/TatE family subunit [Bacteroidaceae bacterium]|nr:twin-arginine translocase TatA/TatE family subunit [Bacteroidaceae bacterium]
MIQPLFLGLGMQEILIILAIVLLLFGGKKIPELMRGAGKGVRAFKDGMKEPTTDDDVENDEKKSDEVNDEK